MKFYEIRLGAIENGQDLAPVEGSQYITLDDAVHHLKNCFSSILCWNR